MHTASASACRRESQPRTDAVARAVRRVFSASRTSFLIGALAASVASTPTALGDPFPPLFDLGSLLPAAGGDGSAGFIVTGAQAHDELGKAVSAGDINGDGISDVIVGAYAGPPGITTSPGHTYVVFGAAQAFPP